MLRAGRRRIARLYRDAGTLLDGLGLSASFTLHELHSRVERYRGREVHLIPRDLPALAPHGLWVGGEHADYVFYDSAAAPVRQHQIVGHELGHVLFDDPSTPAAVDELLALLAPDIDPTVPARLRQRSSYEATAEQRAEAFGTVVVERLHSWSVPHPATDPAVLARAVAALQRGHRT